MLHLPYKLYRYSKTATIGILILVLCLIPSSQFSKLEMPITFADLIVHFIMFFAFSAALAFDIIKRKQGSPKWTTTFAITLITSMFLAFSTELLQEIITVLNRTGSIADLLFDLLGSITGSFVVLITMRKNVPVP